MEKINNEKFGQFIIQLRKEKGLTQKDLAEKLYISDKAVSKWERGLSMPDIALLMPLSQILEVTTTELLIGKRIEETSELSVAEVESLMCETIILSQEEIEHQRKNKKIRKIVFFAGIIIVSLEFLLMYILGYTFNDFVENLLTTELLMLMFGIYFTFFAKEILPAYYDENKISFYNDGFMRINISGMHFNNSNWRYILAAAQLSTVGIFSLFPLLYLTVSWFLPTLWEKYRLIFNLTTLLVLFLPIYLVGKKYE